MRYKKYKKYQKPDSKLKQTIERLPRFLKVFWRQNKPAPRKIKKLPVSQSTCREIGELYLSIAEYEAELKSARKRLSTLTRAGDRGR